MSGLDRSRHIKGGFQLNEDKVLTATNIPQDFDGRQEIKEFFKVLSALKPMMAKMTPKQTELLRRYCVGNPVIEIVTPELKPYVTQDVKDLATVINKVASSISQRGMFQRLLPEVMAAALRQ